MREEEDITGWGTTLPIELSGGPVRQGNDYREATRAHAVEPYGLVTSTSKVQPAYFSPPVAVSKVVVVITNACLISAEVIALRVHISTGKAIRLGTQTSRKV